MGLGNPGAVPSSHSSHSPSLGYRPGLDGFRGAAVAAVLVFHGGFGWARGGFLGVTSFFVLSGFLITSLLLLERQASGRISLRGFWARRARRLVPAALLTLALVVAYVAVAGPGTDGVLGDGLASAAWVANWRFLLEGQSYGGLFSDPSPFQHMWSLAIEEQFYLVLPLAAAALAGRRRLFAAAVGASAVASAAAAWSIGASDRAYYGTDTRVVEPLVGVLLALLLVRRGGPAVAGRRTRWVLDVLAAGALAGLAALVAVADEQAAWVYRGGFVGAAVLSAVVIAAAVQSGTLTSRLFSLPPLVAVGRVSYGVYLFHWPVFLWLSPRRLPELSSVSLFLVRCAVTVALASASYVLVERPVRLSRLPRRVGPVAWANASVGLLAGLVLVVGSTPAPPTSLLLGDDELEPPPVVASASSSPSDVVSSAADPTAPTSSSSVPRAVVRRPAAASASATTRPSSHGPSSDDDPLGLEGGDGVGAASPAPPSRPSVDGDAASSPLKVAVVGDSMAWGLAVGLEAWAAERDDVVVYRLAIPGCPISRGGYRWINDREHEVREVCGWWGDPEHERWRNLVAFDPDVVVMQDGMNALWDRRLDHWGIYRGPGDPLFDQWMLSEYEAALDQFESLGATTLFLNAACADWGRLAEKYGEHADGEGRVERLNRITEPLAGSTWTADLLGHLCPDGRFTDKVDGVDDARPDGYHLSHPEGRTAVAVHWLGPLLLQAATDPAADHPPRS